jgi:hypothetical protein
MRYTKLKCSSSCEKCVLERLIACLEHCHTQQTTSIPLKGLSQLLRTDSAIQTTAHAPQLPPSANSCTCANFHPPQLRRNVQVIEISTCGSIICENAQKCPRAIRSKYCKVPARLALKVMWVARVLFRSLLNGIAEVFGLPRIICEGCSGRESRLACSRCKVGEGSTGRDGHAD